MKKLLFYLFALISFVSCSEKVKVVENAEKQEPIKHLFKPTYTDNMKIGDQKNVLIVEEFHKAVFAKDYDKVGTFLADTAIFYNEDGTTLKGKSSLIDFMKKNYAPLNFKNYNVGVTFPVVGDNGHQWVLMWDDADVETPDGKVQKYQWMDCYRFENGKIIAFNGFGKAIKD